MTIWFICIILAVWWIVSHYSKAKHTTHRGSGFVEQKEPEHEIKEESVFQTQARFEKHLQDSFLPDAIGGKEIYIYKNLMRPWYQVLAGKNRYDDKMIQKIRGDFLDYMSAIEDASTYNYLWLETPESEVEKAKRYRDDHITASKKSFAIEDAFAAAVGKEAIESLTHAHKLDYPAIDREGNLAPEGQEFDIRGNLRPKKTK